MKRTLKRQLDFTSDDLKAIIIKHLCEIDYPYPSETVPVRFIMGPEGVTMAWDEETEMTI